MDTELTRSSGIGNTNGKGGWVLRSRRSQVAELADHRSGAPVVVAYVANPEVSTSVCLIGYNVAAGMAASTRATVIAHRRDEDALARSLPVLQLAAVGPRRIGDAVRRGASRLFPGRWGLISLLDLPDYLLFDLNAYLRIRRALRAGQDIPYVLRVNPVSFRFPSLLPYLPVPVLTGPHNGGMEWPQGFAHLAGAKGDATGRVRNVGDILHAVYRDVPRYAAILVATSQAASTVPRSGRDRVVLMSENGVVGLAPPSPHRGDARRLLFVGRLNPMKCVDVALRAVARLPQDVTLTIVGDGPCQAELEALAAELQIADRVTFVGHVPHARVADFYAQSGVLVFPSVRESGGGVVLEAMSHGLPCVVADWGGPPELLGGTGLTCRVDNPHVLEDDIVSAVLQLNRDPAAAAALGSAARAHVGRNYLWGAKVRVLHELGMRAVDHGPIDEFVSGAPPQSRSMG